MNEVVAVGQIRLDPMGFLRPVVLLDSSEVFSAVLWESRRTEVQAKLSKLLQQGGLLAVAPVDLDEEVPRKIRVRAKKQGHDEKLMLKIWETGIRPWIRFVPVRSDRPLRTQAFWPLYERDPKDVAFLQVAELVAPDWFFTRDTRHFGDFDIHVKQSIEALRAFERHWTQRALTAGGQMVVSATAQVAEASARFAWQKAGEVLAAFKRLHPLAQIALVLGGAWALSQPKVRDVLTEVYDNVTRGLSRLVTPDGPLAAIASRSGELMLASEATKRRILGFRQTGIRPLVTRELVAFVLARTDPPRTIEEIMLQLEKLGHSRSRSAIYKALNDEPSFRHVIDGRWMLGEHRGTSSDPTTGKRRCSEIIDSALFQEWNGLLEDLKKSRAASKAQASPSEEPPN